MDRKPSAERGRNDAEGYSTLKHGLRGSPLPFLVAIIIAVIAAAVAMLTWESWGGAPRDPGQMNATESGPSRSPPPATAEES